MTTLDMPQETRRPTPAGTRFVDVRANLLPAEVLTRRQVDAVRRRVITMLIALVVLVGLGYGASWYQTHSARSDLAAAHRAIAARQASQGKYAQLAQTQSQVDAAHQKLATLMAGDLSWKTLLTELRAAAPSGVGLTSVNATDAAAGQTVAAAPAADPLNGTGKTSIGTLTITGSARDSRSVASYSDALGRIDGIASVLITSVSGGAGAGTVTFTATAVLTSDLLGGRFTAKTAAAGGN